MISCEKHTLGHETSLMNYQETPEYNQYRDIIEQTKLEPYPLKPMLLENSFDDMPDVINEKHYNQAQQNLKHRLNRKVQFVTVIGFKKLTYLTESSGVLVAQCQCGKYTEFTAKRLEQEHVCIACSACDNLMQSYSLALHNKLKLNITRNALLSIFGDETAHVESLFELPKEASDRAILRDFTFEKLIELTDQYSQTSIDFFKKGEDGNTIINPKTKHPYEKIYINKPECIDITKLEGSLQNRNATQIIGKEFNRFKIVGIAPSGNMTVLTRSKSEYVLKCDCGLYHLLPFTAIRNQNKFCCTRCLIIENEVIRRARKEDVTALDSLAAWKKLGFSKTTFAKSHISFIGDINNSYEIERPTHSITDTSEIYLQRIGMKFGFITIKAKSKRPKQKFGNSIVGVCDCGNEAVFRVSQVLNIEEKNILACSLCTFAIDHTFSVNKTSCLNTTRNVLDERWLSYLEHFDFPIISFETVWNAFLELRAKNPQTDINFKKNLNGIIEHLIKQMK